MIVSSFINPLLEYLFPLLLIFIIVRQLAVMKILQAVSDLFRLCLGQEKRLLEFVHRVNVMLLDIV
jgi:hypothetical protein